jgi:hypothetical protein
MATSAIYQKLPQPFKPLDNFSNISHALLDRFSFFSRQFRDQLVAVLAKFGQYTINVTRTQFQGIQGPASHQR